MHFKTIKNYLPIFLIITTVIYSQSKSNFEVVESLVSNSISKINFNTNNVNDEGLSFKFNSPNDYEILKSSIIRDLQKMGIKVKEDSSNSGDKLNYNLVEIKVNYPEMFRDGLFGEYLVTRNVSLDGSYFFSIGKRINDVINFKYTAQDTIPYSDITNVENIAYSFTTAEIPEEPFISSSLEPILAVGTAAIAVYLFFNVRSK